MGQEWQARLEEGLASPWAKLLLQLGTGPEAPWSPARWNCFNGLRQGWGWEPKLVFIWNT